MNFSKRSISILGIGVTVLLLSCKSEEKTQLESFFADVEIPVITLQDAVNTGKIEYTTYITIGYNDGVPYIPIGRHNFVLEYSETDSGIDVLATSIGAMPLNSGTASIGNDGVTITCKGNYDEGYECLDGIFFTIESFPTDNLAFFNSKDLSDDIYCAAKASLWEEIVKKTPEIIYTADDGSELKIKYYPFLLPVKGCQAIVDVDFGFISEALLERFTFEFEPLSTDQKKECLKKSNEDYNYDFSNRHILTANNRIALEMEGDVAEYYGPTVNWSPDRIVFPADVDKNLPEMIFLRKKDANVN